MAEEVNAASLSEQAWRIEQFIARDETLGFEPDVAQLAREVGALALIVAQLAKRIEANV